MHFTRRASYHSLLLKLGAAAPDIKLLEQDQAIANKEEAAVEATAAWHVKACELLDFVVTLL